MDKVKQFDDKDSFIITKAAVAQLQLGTILALISFAISHGSLIESEKE